MITKSGRLNIFCMQPRVKFSSRCTRRPVLATWISFDSHSLLCYSVTCYLIFLYFSGQLSSIAPIYVHVSDVNDNRPQLRDFTVLYASHADELVEREIGSVPALLVFQGCSFFSFLKKNVFYFLKIFSVQGGLNRNFAFSKIAGILMFVLCITNWIEGRVRQVFLSHLSRSTF